MSTAYYNLKYPTELVQDVIMAMAEDQAAVHSHYGGDQRGTVFTQLRPMKSGMLISEYGELVYREDLERRMKESKEREANVEAGQAGTS